MQTITRTVVFLGLLGCPLLVIPTASLVGQTTPQSEPRKTPPVAKKTPKNFTIGKGTTFLSEPLDESGHMDYVAALNNRLSKDVTPENNANVLIWKALGPIPEGPLSTPAGVFDKLGMPTPPLKGEYFVTFQKYLIETQKLDADAADAAMNSLGGRCQSPWIAKDDKLIAGWLKANEKPLALVLEAAKRPQFYSPQIPRVTPEGQRSVLIDMSMPALQGSRWFVTALMSRAMLAVGEGTVDSAWEDLLTCHRLARLIGRGATLLEGLVALGLEKLTCHADLAFLERTRPDSKLLKRYLQDLAALPAMPDMAEKADYAERFLYLDGIMLMSRYGLGYMERLAGLKEAQLGDGAPNVKDLDLNPALETVNPWFNRLAAAMREPTRTERVKALDQIENDLSLHRQRVAEVVKALSKATEKGSVKLGSQFIGEATIVSFPMILARKVQDNVDQTRQAYTNIHLAFTLALYRSENGKYPESLDSLVPKYLPKAPADLLSGKPLMYRPTANGYLLYSVGLNGTDDGGRDSTAQPPGDDLVVRMFAR